MLLRSFTVAHVSLPSRIHISSHVPLAGDSGAAATSWVHWWGRDVSEGNRAPSHGLFRPAKHRTPDPSSLAPGIWAPGCKHPIPRLTSRALASVGGNQRRRRATGWSRCGWQQCSSTCCRVGARGPGAQSQARTSAPRPTQQGKAEPRKEEAGDGLHRAARSGCPKEVRPERNRGTRAPRKVRSLGRSPGVYSAGNGGHSARNLCPREARVEDI
jgi:hypothetical protein